MGCARGLLALALLLAVVATLGFSAQGVPLTHARLHTGNQAYFIDDLTEFFQWDNTVRSLFFFVFLFLFFFFCFFGFCLVLLSLLPAASSYLLLPLTSLFLLFLMPLSSLVL